MDHLNHLPWFQALKAEVFGGGKNEGDTLQGSGMLLFVSAPRSCGADTSLSIEDVKKSVFSLRPTLIARSFYQLYKVLKF